MLLPVVLCLFSVMTARASFWLEGVPHQGAAIGGPANYKVFRNVRDYGAKGDGNTDDTQAIKTAIRDGTRCEANCGSQTTAPALIYFPAGQYVLSASLTIPYMTQLIGDYNDVPQLIASSTFQGAWMVDFNPYGEGGVNWVGPTNNFFKSFVNFKVDVRAGPANLVGVHWQVSQATTLTNCQFIAQPGTQQVGVFIENGSLGMISDLTFSGGTGLFIGNQQYTLRNLTFNNCDVAISTLWDWTGTIANLTINNCAVGINIPIDTTKESQQVNGLNVIDVQVTNTPIFMNLSRSDTTSRIGPGASILLENVQATNVGTIILNGTATALAGSSGTTQVAAWGIGAYYTGSAAPIQVFGTINPAKRPDSLVTGDRQVYFGKSRPQYPTASASDFVSVKDLGAAGDGQTDDTNALQKALDEHSDKIIYVPHGIYLITSTLKIPIGTRIVGEIWPVLMGSGTAFADVNNATPVVQVGEPGSVGTVELTDLWFSTRGPAGGAIVVQWNTQQEAQGSASMHSSHIILGGFAGTNLQHSQCSSNATYSDSCRAAFLGLHVTPSASLYDEEGWIWLADHDLETKDANQTTIVSERGALIQAKGPVWLWGTSSEHHILYQYNFQSASNIFASMLQTETPYFLGEGFQPMLSISPRSDIYNDPTWDGCANGDPKCLRSWGVWAKSCSNLFIYGLGTYSFFDNYTQTCIASNTCQTSINNFVDTSDSVLYGLATIGVTSMVNVDGQPVVKAADNAMGGAIAASILAWVPA